MKLGKSVGANIRRGRMSKGMTQEQLAARMQLLGCDVSRGTLAKLETGLRHISVKEFEAVRQILDMSYEDFFEQT